MLQLPLLVYATSTCRRSRCTRRNLHQTSHKIAMPSMAEAMVVLIHISRQTHATRAPPAAGQQMFTGCRTSRGQHMSGEQAAGTWRTTHKFVALSINSLLNLLNLLLYHNILQILYVQKHYNFLLSLDQEQEYIHNTYLFVNNIPNPNIPAICATFQAIINYIHNKCTIYYIKMLQSQSA